MICAMMDEILDTKKALVRRTRVNKTEKERTETTHIIDVCVGKKRKMVETQHITHIYL